MNTAKQMIGYVEDHRGAFDWEPDEFHEGFEQALHMMYEVYINYSGEYSCCDEMYAEAYNDGTWRCSCCGTTLVGPDEDVVPRGEME